MISNEIVFFIMYIVTESYTQKSAALDFSFYSFTFAFFTMFNYAMALQ